jgi:hypothetical protein
MAGRQQQIALMRVEGELVHLASMLVEPGQLDASAVEVIDDDLAVGGGSGDVRAEGAM